MLEEKFTAITSFEKRDSSLDLFREMRTYAIHHRTDKTSRLPTCLQLHGLDQEQGRQYELPHEATKVRSLPVVPRLLRSCW
jgi:hypothetical protein